MGVTAGKLDAIVGDIMGVVVNFITCIGDELSVGMLRVKGLNIVVAS